MDKINTIINNQNFNPSFLGLFTNPFYFARKGLFQNIKKLSGDISGKTLDVGCGSKPYQKLFINSTKYVGLEIDSNNNRSIKKADFFYDGKIFPFNDEEFDSVIANQVFEHVFNPDEFLKELNRILKINGTVLMSVPFVWDEHEQPHDYARYSFFGLSHILEKNGFYIVEHRKSMDDIRVIFQLINAYIFKITLTKNPYINLLSCIFLMSPFNICGEILSKILPKNEDLYLDNIVIVKKIIKTGRKLG